MSTTISNNEKNTDFIEQLRNTAEEIDFNQFLKNSFGGGYTKQSVLDYLSLLRKQQQVASENFYNNLQNVYKEKEELQGTMKKLQARLQKVEIEYQNLADVTQNIHPENEELTLANMVALQSRMEATEEEIKRMVHDKQLADSRLEQLEQDKMELTEKSNQLLNENSAQKELIKTLRQEIKKQYDVATDLSNKLEIEQEENKYLRGKFAESENSRYKQKVIELTEQLSLQTEIIQVKEQEIIQKENVIRTLGQEIETLKLNTVHLSKMSEEINEHNERLLLSNQELVKMLEEELSDKISIINEKSTINREKIAVKRLLEEANSKIVLLELQIEKQGKVNDSIKSEEADVK